MLEPITSLMNPGEVSSAIGTRVRAARRAAKMSRKELAIKSGVSVPTIARLELTGTATLMVLIKLAQTLNLVESFDRLFVVSKFNSIDEFLGTQEKR